MIQSPLSDKKFRGLFAGCWAAWTLLHLQLLVWLGQPVRVAVIDSGIANGLLAAGCLLIASILRFYRPRQQRYSFLIGLCVVITAMWFFSSRALTLLFLPDDEHYSLLASQAAVVRAVIGFLIIGCMTLLCVLWYSLAEQREGENRRQEAEQLAREAELFKLRQQLQPHFLFNSLNSINALVSLNPALARKMIQQLSDFLRGTVRREETAWVALNDELQQTELYLEIEKVRFGHRLQAQLLNEAGTAIIPAMLLQPVVENAIKFGLYDTTGDVYISIKTWTNLQDLMVQVQNPFDAETHAAHRGTGFGLASVQRRLYLLFGRHDLLQTETVNNQFITTIKIPQRDQNNRD